MIADLQEGTSFHVERFDIPQDLQNVSTVGQSTAIAYCVSDSMHYMLSIHPQGTT